MNEMIASGEVKELDHTPAKYPFSYNACCLATLSEKGCGRLDKGTGVALSSGDGDGSYPVFALVEDGKIKQVIIKFLD